MSESRVQPLATLPVASTSLTNDPVFVDLGGRAELRVEFEQVGKTINTGFRFEKVRAFRFRSEGHCTAWHIENAYDSLVEVRGSLWTAELRADEPPGSAWEWDIRHFMIYLDSAGAYEVAAAAWSWLSEETAQ